MASALSSPGLIFAACCLTCRQVYWSIRYPNGIIESALHDCLVLAH